jgi:hypothetical protein
MANRSPLTAEFKAAHDAFEAGGFADGWKFTAKHLAKLSDADGPHDAEAAWLDSMRVTATTKDGRAGKVSEAEGLLHASKGYDLAKPADASKLDAAARQRAAALKLMRHLYLVRQRGGQKVWILGLANSFRDWPSVALATGNLAEVKLLLGDKKEPLSTKDKKHLADAAQEGMKQVHRATIALAAASGKGKEAAAAQALVKRWFTGAGASADDVTTAVATLLAGFKKIQAVLSSGRLLFTDHPEVRHATDAENAGFWESEAFVKGAREDMDVVYIESAFFKKGNTLEGLKNWARIVVHELSHRELATKDHAYSWRTGGIEAGVGLTPAEAITNADSWAFFAVDCAGQLTASELKAALT